MRKNLEAQLETKKRGEGEEREQKKKGVLGLRCVALLLVVIIAGRRRRKTRWRRWKVLGREEED